MTSLAAALICASALSVACAALSVFVVSRRWAFIGEGIAHSGFGGAGTAWMLALIFPALDGPEMQWLPYCGVIVFALLSALAIGAVTRHGMAESDTAIGIFMVASVAWGFIAREAYMFYRKAQPHGWQSFFFGEFRDVDMTFAITSTLLCLAVIATVWLMGKEIFAYCFDPETAEASGVRAGFVHYLMILLVTATIVIGSRIVGSILVTALLVLPGATSLAISRRLSVAVGGSVALALVAAIAGVLISRQVQFLTTGPAIVLILFAVFVVVFVGKRVRRS
ncbi:metal ABC transporter permease [Humisphaera borealis]|uniref:Metal ABC transporter permease n=1 Tax=Humisphaera borealis TaxID=2807512 RepID=A0A7M2WUF3_9BACT|nr:metal ABC transporter permease [Humisphaera borealis]QOV89155.1 metal ABC transporter permease [Humisphaera borealis]